MSAVIEAKNGKIAQPKNDATTVRGPPPALPGTCLTGLFTPWRGHARDAVIDILSDGEQMAASQLSPPRHRAS